MTTTAERPALRKTARPRITSLTQRERFEAGRRQWREERNMTEEELAVAHLRFEARIEWIDPSAKTLPWLREELREFHQRTGAVAATRRGDMGRIVAYSELRLDTQRDTPDDFFLRRVWYLNPYDHDNPDEIPSGAVLTSTIKAKKPSQHPD